MTTTMQLGESYQERVCLPGGEWVRMRLLRPGDKELLRKGFNSLSAHSRYKRFLAVKKTLSKKELCYFTEIDQEDHFALCIVGLDKKSKQDVGIGVGRFIRLGKDSDCAEVSLTVIDRMQGKGIGRLLLEKLIVAATERDIKRFRFECLPQNQEMKKLVQKVCPIVEFKNDAGIMIADAVIAEQETDSRQHSLNMFEGLIDLMGGFAAETLKLQSGFGFEMVRRSLDTLFELRGRQVAKEWVDAPVNHLSRTIVRNNADYYHLLRSTHNKGYWTPWVH
ncbi:MAG: GNAT family N-acetyltransferase [Candidatus Thiodiazotropha sp.]|nr:GNAT family N-acetyltransferase [Candidatus Thiodiazotropha sp.]MCM8883520.1 GNAT family N-acetyltransferase [Candidatus Thiodiazotropha sp.]MCM8919067.1 GNAT family N-acetyltransferase [Candidatus Thiodiazotropha sp.]MCU7873390.1 GNAT family N-acetyltransferase [Candidatus Thiodiazotropha sp. (ex Lucinoma borealis)]